MYFFENDNEFRFEMQICVSYQQSAVSHQYILESLFNSNSSF
jgi:hypothetical protein